MGLMTITLAECEAREAATEAVRRAKALAVATAQADVDHAARSVAACALVAELAGQTGLGPDAIWGAMAAIPYNLQSLLDTPQGWSAVAGFVASELGVLPPDYMPAVH